MNQQQKNNATPPGQGTNWVLVVCHFVSLPVELLLHNTKTFGIRSVSPRIGGALLLMFLFVAFHPSENCVALICFMFAVGVLGSVSYISAARRQLRGEAFHSRYTGAPYAKRLFRRWSEVTIKRLEPFAVLAAGGIIHHFNHALGSFLIAAAVGLGVKVGGEYRAMWERDMEMNDALINQRISIEKARGLRR